MARPVGASVSRVQVTPTAPEFTPEFVWYIENENVASVFFVTVKLKLDDAQTAFCTSLPVRLTVKPSVHDPLMIKLFWLLMTGELDGEVRTGVVGTVALLIH